MGAGMSMSSSDEAKTEKIESEASRELAAANPDEAKMTVSSSDEAKAEKIESDASRELAAANPDEAKMTVSSSDEDKAEKFESEASRKMAAAKPDEANAEKESESSRKLASEKPEEAKTENGSPGGEKAGECPLCLFMKGGGCKESFIAWEKCIEDSENGKDDCEKKCLKVNAALIECMQAHFDYYEPILKLHKVMEAEPVAARDSEQTKRDDHPEEAVSKEK